LPPGPLVSRLAQDSVSQTLLAANNWASSFAKALADVGYPILLSPGSMEVVDSTLVLHLLAQRLAAIYVPTPDNIHPRSCLSAGVVACIYARWFSSPYRLDIGLPCFTWCFRRMIFVFSSDSVLGVVVSHRYWPPLASFPYPSGSAFLFEVCLPVGL
jgi:hypothetical protein